MSRGCSNFVKFQSTLPRGERLAQYVIYYNHRNISIHAPARGATSPPISFSASYTRFQSTLPRGERRTVEPYGPPSSPFQSTLPRGERPWAAFIIEMKAAFQSTLPRGERLCLLGITFGLLRDFNPRSREGSDVEKGAYHGLCIISIHAPARGATSILSKIHPMFLTISHNASSFSSFPFHSFLPHLLNSSTFCALFQVRISRAFSVYYRFAPKKSTPDL